MTAIKNTIKSEIIVIILENDIHILRQKTPKEISVIFNNGSTYDYHFIINELAKTIGG